MGEVLKMRYILLMLIWVTGTFEKIIMYPIGYIVIEVLDFFTSDSQEMIDQFQKMFPGECMICSYHRYGLQEGHLKAGSKPESHICIEDKS